MEIFGVVIMLIVLGIAAGIAVGTGLQIAQLVNDLIRYQIEKVQTRLKQKRVQRYHDEIKQALEFEKRLKSIMPTIPIAGGAKKDKNGKIVFYKEG